MLQPSRQLEKIMKAEGPKKLTAGTSRKSRPEGGVTASILHIKNSMIVCLFVQSWLRNWQEPSDLKFGMRVEDVVSRKLLLRSKRNQTFCHLSQTNFWERWQNVLAYQICEFQSNCVGFQLVLLLPIDWVAYMSLPLHFCSQLPINTIN